MAQSLSPAPWCYTLGCYGNNPHKLTCPHSTQKLKKKKSIILSLWTPFKKKIQNILQSFFNLQCINRFLYWKLVITDIKLLLTGDIPPTWWDAGWLQLPGVPVHAGGVRTELEGSAAQSMIFLLITHLPAALEAAEPDQSCSYFVWLLLTHTSWLIG